MPWLRVFFACSLKMMKGRPYCVRMREYRSLLVPRFILYLISCVDRFVIGKICHGGNSSCGQRLHQNTLVSSIFNNIYLPEELYILSL